MGLDVVNTTTISELWDRERTISSTGEYIFSATAVVNNDAAMLSQGDQLSVYFYFLQEQLIRSLQMVN